MKKRICLIFIIYRNDKNEFNHFLIHYFLYRFVRHSSPCLQTFNTINNDFTISIHTAYYIWVVWYLYRWERKIVRTQTIQTITVKVFETLQKISLFCNH